MSATLHVRLLGAFSLSAGDDLLTGIATPRLQSLAAYLMLHRDAPQSRQHVAFLFWPDVSDAQARNNLRQFLHQLRSVLPDADQFLQVGASTLHWCASQAFKLDVAEFESAIVQAHAARKARDDSTARAALEHAASLYGGDLLPSCYDDWVAPERARLHDAFMHTLHELTHLLETQRDYASALSHAQRLRDLDPLHEESHLQLLRLHALNEDRASALRIYHDYAALLKRELDVEPGPAMRDAYERLLHADVSFTPTTLRTKVFDVATPLIGRQREWTQLQAAWQLASHGHAHFVLISGEAGIGKSRLAEELLMWVSQQGFAAARTRAYAAEGQLSYVPVIEWLRSDAVRQSLDRMDKVWLSEIARVLPELLAQHPDLMPPQPMSDYAQRQRFFEALARAALNASQPLLLVMDDLQWCNQDTLEWLRYLLHFDARARLLVVGTARAEELDVTHPLTSLLLALRSDGQTTEIELQPLDSVETASLASNVAGKDLDADRATRLFHETEGNPLFVVEMVRAGSEPEETRDWRLEAPTRQSPIPNLQSLPPKVYAVIAGRLAQLSPSARAFAQLAATIGREFTFDVLLKASESDEDDVVHGLDELWQRRIIQEHNADGYDFSHDKIRDVAYAEISPAQRRLLHRRTAQALEAIHTADFDPVSAQLAAHYEQAAMPEQAITFYQRAAEVAQRVYAYEGAISLSNRGLALLHTLPQSASRDEWELALITTLGVMLVATKGYSAKEVSATLYRAQTLSQQLNKPPNPTLLRALAIAYICSANYQGVSALGEQLLDLAVSLNDPLLLVEGHYVLGVVHFWLGSIASSCVHLERAITHYDPRQSRVHIALYSQDPKVICQCRLAFDLWCLGYPDQAMRMQDESLELAQALSHPFSLAYALVWGAKLNSMAGNVEVARQHAESVIALSQQHGLEWWLRYATVLHGQTVAAGGAMETGIAETERAMADFSALGAEEWLRPYFNALLAEQYARSGKVERGVELLADALAVAEKNGERWFEAELHRTRGDVLLAKGVDAQEIEAVYRRALDVAQAQQAKSFELRAATSLARLWQAQGKAVEARNLLTLVYAWFTEGFDTLDLIEARALLDQLTFC